MPNNFVPAMVKRSIIKIEQIMFTRTLNKNKLLSINNGHTSNNKFDPIFFGLRNLNKYLLI